MSIRLLPRVMFGSVVQMPLESILKSLGHYNPQRNLGSQSKPMDLESEGHTDLVVCAATQGHGVIQFQAVAKGHT